MVASQVTTAQFNSGPATASPGEVHTFILQRSENQRIVFFEFEILQSSSTVAGPVDILPTLNLDEGKEYFIFTAPTFTG